MQDFCGCHLAVVDAWLGHLAWPGVGLPPCPRSVANAPLDTWLRMLGWTLTCTGQRTVACGVQWSMAWFSPGEVDKNMERASRCLCGAECGSMGVWGALRRGGTLGRRLWAPTLAVGHRGLATLASDSGAQLTTGYRLSEVVHPLPLHLLLQWRALHDRSSFGRLWCLLCNDGDHDRHPLHMHRCHFGSRLLPCAL